MIKLNDYSYDEIKIGDTFEFNRKLSDDDVRTFANLTQDKNPLHCDEEYAKNTKFRKRIVHGLLAGSLFSTLVGMLCPGRKNLYVSQSLNFKNPIPIGSKVTVKGIIKNKIDSLKMIEITTQILVKNQIMIEGEAKVLVMENEG